ncbi:hypothetical protein DIU31_006025 [Mucilaginibacter rubeus]|uniref:Uncharacterized protein n=1 Tax=Mucilaginibacter rubeus TaxID=2027860 RepID=A0AAE6JD23_9SPHI|nr:MULTISPECIES: hypothetical protein [Mucilaginibacter]QEM03098.1 hypothetical protein DIU31_006025 [Mucilaginibacter rubeus]QEM15716.1 hypothetical protein DIU38_006095 [Mucilaginibacter gossypii]QTE41544.1 hypothetical protein J3L19_21685 [Mucilaginibacter rubeus]QTE48150.1 hypothetical protein J3L21_21685 [Mucilaginibacter rubeus]QTE59541.1 hypothetical protein J3L23_13330 [Mucilaginibacter rubeus]
MGNLNFTLTNEPGADPMEIISLKEMGLYLKVIPGHLQKEIYPSDHIIFIAKFFAKTMKGGLNKDASKETHFQLLNSHSEKRRFWDNDLFKSAIDYYCREHLHRPCNELAMVMKGQLFKWDEDQYFD